MAGRNHAAHRTSRISHWVSPFRRQRIFIGVKLANTIHRHFVQTRTVTRVAMTPNWLALVNSGLASDKRRVAITGLIRRRDSGRETLADIARSYNVNHSTISRL